MNRNLLLFIIAFCFVSCLERRAKIDYNNEVDTVATIANFKQDTSKVLVADLPVRFDSTNILLYAVRLVDLEKQGRKRSYDSYGYSSSNYSASYFRDDVLSQNMVNLVFEDPDGKRKTLTNHQMTITRVLYLRDIFKSTTQSYLLYTVYDRDTNGDGQFDGDDLQSLYLSRVDGSEFKKITKELHEYYDYQILKDDNKLYFRTREDINQDGKLNNEDQFHYYQIKFRNNGYLVSEYNPLDVFAE